MRYLYVGRMGAVDEEACAVVRERLGAEYETPVKDIELPPADFALDADRNQYASIAILEMLVGRRPEDALALLAVTERDLYIPVLTFVFGQAQLGGHAAVISLARLRQDFYGLKPNREAFLQRAIKEAFHETGHTFGLVHCADRSCVMSLSTGVRQIDGKNAAFCVSCGALLRRRRRE